MRVKTYKKSAAFWKHGKHKSVLYWIRAQEKNSLGHHKRKMYSSVRELMEREVMPSASEHIRKR